MINFKIDLYLYFNYFVMILAINSFGENTVYILNSVWVFPRVGKLSFEIFKYSTLCSTFFTVDFQLIICFNYNYMMACSPMFERIINERKVREHEKNFMISIERWNFRLSDIDFRILDISISISIYMGQLILKRFKVTSFFSNDNS